MILVFDVIVQPLKHTFEIGIFFALCILDDPIFERKENHCNENILHSSVETFIIQKF